MTRDRIVAPESAGSAAVASASDGALVARSGAELVELSERYYCGVFRGSIALVGLASLFALALLPTRKSVPSDLPPITVALAVVLIGCAPFAIRRSQTLYTKLRRSPKLELLLVAAASAFVAYPLRSELWWPSCGLLMLLATLVPMSRALAYCFVVLAANLLAHVVAGDIAQTPAVSIVGLWIGLVFWTSMFALLSDRLAAFALRINQRPDAAAVGPLRVHAWVDHEPPDATRTDDVDAVRRPPPGPQPALDRLTARQLQVVVLLADGLRYRDIAHCLAISERQVQRHVRNAVAQLGVSSTAELAAVAVAMGVVPARDAGSPVVGEPPSPAASYCRAGLAPDAGMPEPAEDDEPDPSE